ncbi:4-alpha-glucanotransferase [Aggregatibacter actinomycetemcomitans]|uniref:4-alpha-glucanotransferase n=1 Tax=Aggregatibacter actinomycetemcomitans TaxID=714 RepID=UPI00022BFF86|nr:4-alpha-glucanotransferase [Aggregatibacter actinomycetemcomitans]AEW77522.1 4-alpha-glucanotransferase [Aggregatibacter actinomycetemcomitans ANH9381]KOE53350.1 4-alpha-glucanotransferase [Aggregatibacter actinomycetemcomitans serotype b str. S23A]KOE53445.1 4-alpha-glucanotransferase [Aggregatibacter actinomycetemcomitans serotype b str. I23C]UXM97491.1 4-alpha-glucanotransferase [Aggregatibacter actinomycetemcomitans]
MSIKEKRFDQAGIMPYFFDERGQKIRAPLAIKKALLSTFEGHINSRTHPLPPVKILRQNQPHFLSLNVSDASRSWQGKWQLHLEDNAGILEGKVKKNSITLPRDLPLGYHDLVLHGGKEEVHCRLIVAPQRCYEPEAFAEQKKLWGSFIQLYTLKSERNWGVGDFGDLQEFIRGLAPYQADFLGLNPIHALFPGNPDGASPYSPSSRKWLNIIYINIDQLPEFQQSAEAQRWFNSAEVQEKLNALRAAEWIDYAEVMALKLKGLHFAFAEFKENPTALSQQAFADFVRNGGESLQVQATFDALHAHLSARYREQWGWDFWAPEFQDYHSEVVAQFRRQYGEEIEFYVWLQFCADQQLAECDALCKAQQMTIGMYRDLAVGVTGSGSETWSDKELYCLRASVGAPPDVLGPQGQNWGLTPMNPHILKQRAYQPFIDLVRANMNHCGALRIDHIMSLLRLWWIPKGDSSVNGAYVRYPVDDLIAILALESQRRRCVIIGEDLGTVPKEIVSKLKNAGILSYKIFYFEFDKQGQSRDLRDYPYQAMTTLSTHDLPTINGYWRGYDFELGQKYGVYPNPQILEILKKDRVKAKAGILQRLKEHDIDVDAGIDETLSSDVNKKFVHQLQSYVAEVNSALFGFQPEDWLGMTEPVNIPGTSMQYANWRRRLTQNTDAIFADQDIQKLLKEVNAKRKG